MNSKKALILIDLQNDFCQNGSLAVPDGDAVIPIANRIQPFFDVVVATQDWHPENHSSFLFNQGPWPVHCVQHSKGAEFHPQLKTDHIDRIIFKGVDQAIDSYSAFFDNAHLRSTELADYLHQEKIKTVYIMGLATDYCVKYSCLDAIELGFKVFLIENGCRGVELHSGDSAKALEEMKQKGVNIITSDEIINDY